MSKITKIIWLIIAAVVVVGLVWWGVLKNNGSSNVIKIGFIGPLTGNSALFGETYRNVVALASDEINSTGGITGKHLEIIYEDGKCTGEGAAGAINKLVYVDKVQVVLGGFCSGESVSAVPIAAKNKVVLFSPGSTGPTLTGISPYFFRDVPSAATQGQILAQIAFSKKGWKKIALIQEQTDFAAGVYKVFNQEFTSLGGQISKEEFPSQTDDFRSIILKLRSSNSDALFIDAQAAPQASKIIKQMQEIGWKPSLLLSNSITGDPKFLSDNKDFIEGALTAKFGVDTSNAKFIHLVSAYKQKYGSEPAYEDYAQTEYDAVYLLKDAISQVGYSGEKIAQWLGAVKDWDGASGKITILPNGDRDSSQVPEVITSGTMMPY
jgi:branched-chain amino acid transport system substrate-binding protein